MISEQYKQAVWRRWEESGFKQPKTKQELEIVIELQSRGQKPSKITTRTVRKPVNEVKAFHEMLNLDNY